MASISPPPPFLLERVRTEQLQFLENMKRQANAIAYQKVPRPAKTACKWTDKERKRNNSLSMKRSRVREAEEMRLIRKEYDRLVKRKEWLREQCRNRHLMNSAAAVLGGRIAGSQNVPTNQSMQPAQIVQTGQSVVPSLQFGADDMFEPLGELHHPQSDPMIHLLSLLQDSSANLN